MIEIETIQNTIKEFAEKYNFIQQIDIDNVVKVFNRQNCLEMNNKNFISISQSTYSVEIGCVEIGCVEIGCGKININIYTIDEEERFYIDTTNYFFINTLNYTNEDKLIESIIKGCKNYKLI